MKDMTTRLKSMYKAGILVAACVSLAVCSSCSDEGTTKVNGESDKLNFGVSISDKWNTPTETRSTAGETPEKNAFKFDNSDMWFIATSEEGMDSTMFCKPERAQTRAAEVKDLAAEYTSFGLYAYAYDKDKTLKEGKVYIENEEIGGLRQVGNEMKWEAATTHFWPGEQYRMKFFAFAPYSMSNNIKINDDNVPTFSYTVPTDVAKQQDLLVATQLDPNGNKIPAEYKNDCSGDYKKTLNLPFRHILTAVKIKAAQVITGTVEKVTFKNIKDKGKYTFGATEWEDLERVKDLVLEFSPGKKLEFDGSDEISIADGENTFMMIPQVLGKEATLEVEFDNGEILTGSLYNKVNWEMGHTVIYRISKTEIVVEYEFTAPEQIEFTGDGGSNLIAIESFKTENGVNKTSVSWENAGYYSKTGDSYTLLSDNAVPDWLQFPTCGEGQATYSVEVYSQAGINKTGENDGETGKNSEYTVTSPDIVLQEMQEPSNPTPVNLAGADDKETTANCYIVNAPGWYKFPIVYGNALKDGEKNAAAYDGSCFVNHLDERIINPWLKNNNITISDAVLLWQDSPSGAPLIDESSVQVDGDYIKFHIPKGETCVQGNTVIAVRDKDKEIAWSWHIWVTLHKPDDSFQFKSYSFFNALLGYREAELVTFSKREVYVKLIQKESEKEVYVHISQERLYQFVAAGNAPYYQHGRKDPFPGASLKVERKDGKYSMNVLQNKIVPFEATTVAEDFTLGYVIQHPYTYIGQYSETTTKNSNWYWYLGKNIDIDTDKGNETGYKNLWDNGSKTVYDPCPAGYKIPTKTALERVASTDKANVEYVNTGIYFINNKNTENEQRFFLQILSSRNYEGTSNSTMSKSANADLYCNESNGSTQASYLHFVGSSKESDEPQYTYWVASGTVCAGRCILPQKEE